MTPWVVYDYIGLPKRNYVESFVRYLKDDVGELREWKDRGSSASCYVKKRRSINILIWML